MPAKSCQLGKPLFLLTAIGAVLGVAWLSAFHYRASQSESSSLHVMKVALPTQDTVSELPASPPGPEAPDWVKEPLATTGETRSTVLQSRKYSTVEEANEDLRRQSTSLINAYVREAYPIDHAAIVAEDLIEQAVGRTYVETSSVDFGEFTSDMHRVFWEVQLDPGMRQQVYPAWREQVVRHRSTHVGLGLGGLTLVLGAVATVFRVGLHKNRSTSPV